MTLLSGAAAAWPLAARAEQAGKVYRIGFLANDPTIPTTAAGAAFRDGLSKGGFVEGDNILIDWRFAEGRADRYAELASDIGPPSDGSDRCVKRVVSYCSKAGHQSHPYCILERI